MPVPTRTQWFLLIVFSLFIRLIGVGGPALSHDESLHALYSLSLKSYEHNPMMHGPLLFHLNRLSYTFLGASDFSARFMPALFGTLCVGLLWLYRRWLSERAAFFSAILLALAPDALAYSRYSRNDIYITAFTLISIWALLRWLEEQQPKHLLWLAVSQGLAFSCKEVAFIHGFSLGLFCVLLLSFKLIHIMRNAEDPLSGQQLLLRLQEQPAFSAAVMILAPVLPFVTPLFIEALGGDPLDHDSQEGLILIFSVSLPLFLFGFILSLIVIPARQRRFFIESYAAFWMIQLLLFTSMGFHFPRGFASGISGSLGYWLDQQDVKRGNSDTLFYLSLLLLYSPVLLLGSILRAKQLWAKGFQRIPPSSFLFFWTLLLHAIIYSWAGEKMPWLVLHITLPLCLIAGSAFAQLWETPKSRLWKSLVLLGLIQMLLNSVRVNGPNADSFREPMYYAHGGQDLKDGLALMKAFQDRQPDTWIQVHNDFSWPLAWYLRGRQTSYDKNLENIPDFVSVLLAPVYERSYLEEQGWTPRMEVTNITWPRPDYHRMDWKNFRYFFTKLDAQRKFWPYYLWRGQPDMAPGEFPPPSRFLILTREPNEP